LPSFPDAEQHEFAGGIITPGFVDCHTHLVFGGNRSGEFEQRLNGVSYAEIAASGGGIISTVNATREATEEELIESALFRLRPLLAEGVTSVEIKSGYGLSIDSELKMLRVIRTLATRLPVDIKSTCLAAHALPPEYKDRLMRISACLRHPVADCRPGKAGRCGRRVLRASGVLPGPG
jgi:imidazolonepropionase